jgi:hypothetical protein
MRRRDFIALLAGTAATWPLATRAQQSAANIPVVTLINARKADVAEALAAEFRKGLSQTGLTEGRDVIIEYHWLDGHYENLAAILNDAISRHVAVIATPANTPWLARRQSRHVDHPSCVRCERGPGGAWAGRELGAARWQRDRDQFF